MNIKITDGGRSESRRPMQRNDCVVRTTSILCGVDYDTAYDFWKEEGRKSHAGFDIEAALRRMHKKGQRVVGRRVGPRHSFKRASDGMAERGNDIASFVAEHPRGKYFLIFDVHVSCCIDGVVHDTMLGLSYTHGRLWSFYRIS